MQEKIFIPPPPKDVQLLDDHPAALQRILIMEDEPASAKAFRDFLTANYFDVIFAKSAIEALQEIQLHEFDLVICNMTKSVFAGEMFYKAVERVKPQLCRRFIYMIGHTPDPLAEGFIAKVRGIKLWKPFENHVLLETLSLALKKSTTTPAPFPRKAPQSSANTSGNAHVKTSQSQCPVKEIMALNRLAFVSAAKSIYFATTDFTPDDTLIQLFADAAQRGVKIEILVPLKTKKEIIPDFLRQKFTESGIRLFEGPFAMEAKRMMLIDEQWACVINSQFSHDNANLFQGSSAQEFLVRFKKQRDAAREIFAPEPKKAFSEHASDRKKNAARKGLFSKLSEFFATRTA